jgi:hypothetical protein
VAHAGVAHVFHGARPKRPLRPLRRAWAGNCVMLP